MLQSMVKQRALHEDLSKADYDTMIRTLEQLACTKVFDRYERLYVNWDNKQMVFYSLDELQVAIMCFDVAYDHFDDHIQKIVRPIN